MSEATALPTAPHPLVTMFLILELEENGLHLLIGSSTGPGFSLLRFDWLENFKHSIRELQTNIA